MIIPSTPLHPLSVVGPRSTAGADSRPLTADSQRGEEKRLMETVKQLEGVFVEQLFKAMRETVPDGGLVDGGAGEEIFTGMLDQKLATEVPERWDSELGAALYRQLRGALNAAAPAADPSSVEGES